MTERLTWTKLADGDLLCHQHPIRLAKPMDRRAESPGWMILVPTEEEHDAGGDGWWWRAVPVKGETWPLQANTERDARDLVVEQLDHVLGWIAGVEYPGWTTERRDRVIAYVVQWQAEADAQRAEIEARFEAGRPAREAATRAAAKARPPSAAQVRRMLTEALDLLERARPMAVSQFGKDTWLQRRDALREKAKPITD